MKQSEVYDEWKEHKNQICLREQFAYNLMNQIYQNEQKKNKPLFDSQRLAEVASYHLSAQAALVAAGSVIGLIRFVFMFIVILGFEG